VKYTGGLVFLTYTVFDEAVGEEVERLEVVPCRRCADASASPDEMVVKVYPLKYETTDLCASLE
jgi:hypothetical protein